MNTDTNMTGSGITLHQRKPYTKPQLEILGDLRSLTLGGSRGAGESGASGCRKTKNSFDPQNDNAPFQGEPPLPGMPGDPALRGSPPLPGNSSCPKM